jgi:exonuclease III
MTSDSFRLISWNIGGRVKVNRKQVEVLHSRKPDVVALQEVRASALKRFRRFFPEFDLPHIVESVRLANEYDRRYGELVASRWPLQCLPATDFDTPFPERVLSAVVHSPWGELELHTAHIVPGVSNGWKKIEMFEGIHQRLACQSDIPLILCGDFNSPQLERSDGRLVTWGEKIKRNGEIVLEDRYERWDAGERSVLEGLAKYDLPDVFRRVNGYQVQEFSWFMKRKERIVAKRRFDHVFASSALNAVKCEYLGYVVEQGLSDHSAIEALFEPTAW